MIIRPQGKYYQIIDGHFRYLALKELGVKEVKCEVWDISDREADLLLATLNRLRGSDDTEKRANLVKQVLEDFDNDTSFLNLLPESERAINSLLGTLREDVDIIEIERGLIEDQLTRSGLSQEKSELMANLYYPPSTKPVLKFIFNSETEYNEAVKFFGKEANTKLLISLIKKHDKS